MGVKNIQGGLTINGSPVVTEDTNFSGSYNDLTDKPAIPTATSQLANDSDFATNSSVDTKIADMPNNVLFANSEQELHALATAENNGKIISYDGKLYLANFYPNFSHPPEVGDKIRRLYFNTSVTPDLATLHSLQALKSLAYDETVGNYYFDIVYFGSDYIRVDNGKMTGGTTVVYRTTTGWLQDYWDTGVGEIQVTEVSNQNLWGHLISKSPFEDVATVSKIGPITNTSQLTNDSGFVTDESIPTNTSQLTNDSGFIAGYVTTGQKENTIVGVKSTIEGYQNTADGNYSHAEGYGVIARGFGSHAEGNTTTAQGDYSHAEGDHTLASGANAHAEGYSTTAQGRQSHAEGYDTSALGNYSHAEGYDTIAQGDYSHAEGYLAKAYGKWSHAEGCDTLANEETSHAEGYKTEARGKYSHAAGYETIAQDYQTSVGRRNIGYVGPTSENDTTGTLFMVGCGTLQTRQNAFRVTAAGECMCSTGVLGNGADYAEFYEWLDGNPNNEDRCGYFVTLEGGKIRKATPEDDYILGVVSATPFVVGNSYTDEWHGMFLKDIFGRKLTETIHVPEKIDEHTNKVIPAHTETKFIINPDYDPTVKYIGRNERQEWSTVGTHGQLVVVDDGSCVVNGYCAVAHNGGATKADCKTEYRVTARFDATHIRIVIK